MLSPSNKSHSFVIRSNLLPLLVERGKTQKELAEATGLRPERITRLVQQQVVHTIVTHTAIKLCVALSHWPRLSDGRKVIVRLDNLFPMTPRRNAASG